MNIRLTLHDSLYEKFVKNSRAGSLSESAKDISDWLILNNIEYSDKKIINICFFNS